jgi:MFS family permease
VGSAAVYWLGDYLGRRWTIFTGSVISVFGCALQAGTTTIAMMIAGRFIAGLALGLLTSTIPLYCAELSDKSVRGAMSGLLQWMLSWGFLCAQWIGYGCSFVHGDFQCKSFPLPSSARCELGLTLIRALSSGLPVHPWAHPGLRDPISPRESTLAVREGSSRGRKSYPLQASKRTSRRDN